MCVSPGHLDSPFCELASREGVQGLHTVYRFICFSHPVCALQGWLLAGLPWTRHQARVLQTNGVLPQHVGEDILVANHLDLLEPKLYFNPLTDVKLVWIELENESIISP